MMAINYMNMTKGNKVFSSKKMEINFKKNTRLKKKKKKNIKFSFRDEKGYFLV